MQQCDSQSFLGQQFAASATSIIVKHRQSVIGLGMIGGEMHQSIRGQSDCQSKTEARLVENVTLCRPYAPEVQR